MTGSSDGKKLDSEVDIPALIAALHDKDAVARRRARDQLVALGKPSVGALVELFKMPKSHVRWEAAKALSGIADPTAASILVEVLENDEDSDVRWLAAEGLIAVGRGGLLPLLAALADRPKSTTLQEGAYRVCHHLRRRKAFEMVKHVLAALKDPEPELAIPQAIHTVLEELKD